VGLLRHGDRDSGQSKQDHPGTPANSILHHSDSPPKNHIAAWRGSCHPRLSASRTRAGVIGNCNILAPAASNCCRLPSGLTTTPSSCAHTTLGRDLHPGSDHGARVNRLQRLVGHVPPFVKHRDLTAVFHHPNARHFLRRGLVSVLQSRTVRRRSENPRMEQDRARVGAHDHSRRAVAALGDTAAEFRAGEAEVVAQNP
jgi:hypothetical protein